MIPINEFSRYFIDEQLVYHNLDREIIVEFLEYLEGLIIQSKSKFIMSDERQQLQPAAQQHIPLVQPALSQGVNAPAFSSKFQSKSEVYRFLATEVGCLLPDYNVVTIWHLRDLAAGKR